MPLFNQKLLQKRLSHLVPIPDHHKVILEPWARSIIDGSIYSQNETALHGDFKARILEDVLGYVRFGVANEWTCSAEKQMGRGPVDLAIGHFETDINQSRIIAPIELKGAETRNLDAIMPGRNITPVQQAWQYAVSTRGCRWVIVSNYVELRLYAFGEGTQHYEKFEFQQLTDPKEYARLILLLSANSLLGGETDVLLQESHKAERDVTDALYSDYRTLRAKLLAALGTAAPGIGAEERIGMAQTILDRVLFIAFAEDSGLLPNRTIQKAVEHRDPYHPHLIWENFIGLFRRINEGDPEQVPFAERIPRYNGGLYQEDSRITAIVLPDEVCEGFKHLGEYDFASEIGVTILGHIFEQSISDIERLIAFARGESPDEKKTGTTGRRKRDGVVYTPDYIARFIVDRTLGTHLREIFVECLRTRITQDSLVEEYEKIKWRRPTSGEREAWEDYQSRLARLRIVDPACGSGVFLVMAFDYLKAEYERVNTKVAELKGQQPGLFDPDTEILAHNLFGVDVNYESVEITRLSLWIKTARKGKVLDSLDSNFRVGDSLIEDRNYAYREHGFNWRESFPQVFSEGGFDIVLGNPPYVRMERIKAMKPYLKGRYAVVADRADLYAYFYERGLRALKPGGRLGYISSSSFFKARFGYPLRQHLRHEAMLETVTEFGDHSVFEGVVTYPVIMTMKKTQPSEDHEIKFHKFKNMPERNFSVEFDEFAEPYPQRRLNDGSWEFESSNLYRIRRKIRAVGTPLEDVYGSPLYGIKTGLNEAFIIDGETRQRLVAEDAHSAALLKPLAVGDDCERWQAELQDRWLIYIPKSQVDINQFSAIRRHLARFREKLDKRATKQAWFELQQPQYAYAPSFEGVKIIYPIISQGPKFSIFFDPLYINDKAFAIPGENWDLLALLNSKLFWFFVSGLASPLRGGVWRYELREEYLKRTPIPASIANGTAGIGALARAATLAANERLRHQVAFRRRIADLCPKGRDPNLSGALRDWWSLANFAAFRRAVRACFKIDLPPKIANEWDDYFGEEHAEVVRLTSQIEDAEAEINTRVYALFDLTPDEIALLDAST